MSIFEIDDIGETPVYAVIWGCISIQTVYLSSMRYRCKFGHSRRFIKRGLGGLQFKKILFSYNKVGDVNSLCLSFHKRNLQFLNKRRFFKHQRKFYIFWESILILELNVCNIQMRVKSPFFPVQFELIRFQCSVFINIFISVCSLI